MTTMISNLPRVLIEEIFCRVPLKSLRAVRLTCKSWNTLSKSRSFRKLYIGKRATREEESMMIAMMNFDLHSMRLVVDDVDPSIKFKRKPSRLFDKQVKISQVFHCEGLLLCIFKDDDSKFVVWNPYSGKTRWIEPRYSHRPKGWDRADRFSYALGYENKKFCSGVKFLRFIDYFNKAPENQFFWYEIYDFDSDSWTSLDVTPNWCIIEFEIWITTKIDVEMVSWSKFLRMETGTRLHDLPHIYEGFFIDEEKKLAMGFEDEYYRRTFVIIGEAGYVRKFDIGVDVDRECWPHGCGSYVPSLVRIKKPARGKRKRQSSLEKRRFDQNKSRLEAFEKLGV
ncbi:PREDICTED: F-box protein At2g38590-like [Camelina sativa]|uniref:F-box protein At2g38590-like n=1 Tax=Camelina sativa TaxID=90675 RepID=A0ABM1RL78_CAMSA|nr:PREDICTED: F-box protein At2g38590-like [Camelina sativa]